MHLVANNRFNTSLRRRSGLTRDTADVHHGKVRGRTVAQGTQRAVIQMGGGLGCFEPTTQASYAHPRAAYCVRHAGADPHGNAGYVDPMTCEAVMR